MKRITIGFSYSKTLVSKIIRAVEGTEFSHVFVVLPNDSTDDANEFFVYQESYPACNKVPLVDYCSPNHNSVVTEYHFIPATEDQLAEVIEYAENCVRNKVPYGSFQLVGMGISALFRKFGIKVKNPFSDGGTSMVCSEFAGRVLGLVGINISKSDLENEGPVLIHRIVKQHSECVDQ